MRIAVAPEMLSWARHRARLDFDYLVKTFPKLSDWERGKIQPTLKQLENYANKTHLPVGMFFLNEPPKEDLPIKDFRIMGTTPYDRPSPDLLETIYICQQRQEWYRDYVKIQGMKPLDFIGSKTLDDNIVSVATDISATMHFDFKQRLRVYTWTDALRMFVDQVEKQEIMIMISGVVGSNNYRKLDPEEFRGFMLADNLAPLIFVNANDTISAKIFTLAHELAHLWLGESGVSNMSIETIPDEKTERWCNRVAAEILVPMTDLRNVYLVDNDLHTEMERLARRYKVSTLVILRRIFDMGAINEDTFWEAWHLEFERLLNIEHRSGTGGNFYHTLGVRISKRFVSSLVASTLEGNTLFRDAFRMLGIKKDATFYEIAHKFGY